MVVTGEIPSYHSYIYTAKGHPPQEMLALISKPSHEVEQSPWSGLVPSKEQPRASASCLLWASSEFPTELPWPWDATLSGVFLSVSVQCVLKRKTCTAAPPVFKWVHAIQAGGGISFSGPRSVGLDSDSPDMFQVAFFWGEEVWYRSHSCAEDDSLLCLQDRS